MRCLNKRAYLNWFSFIYLFFRPPEYYTENNIAAAAVDLWSIGITAFEVLTGGYLTIQSERASVGQKFHEFMQAEGLLELSNFSSAVDACWKYTEFVGTFTEIVQIGGTKINLCPSEFLRDSWEFVISLMQYKPSDRASIEEALKSPFITKAKNPNLQSSFRCFRSNLYVGIKHV